MEWAPGVLPQYRQHSRYNSRTNVFLELQSITCQTQELVAIGRHHRKYRIFPRQDASSVVMVQHQTQKLHIWLLAIEQGGYTDLIKISNIGNPETSITFPIAFTKCINCIPTIYEPSNTNGATSATLKAITATGASFIFDVYDIPTINTRIMWVAIGY